MLEEGYEKNLYSEILNTPLDIGNINTSNNPRISCARICCDSINHQILVHNVWWEST